MDSKVVEVAFGTCAETLKDSLWEERECVSNYMRSRASTVLLCYCVCSFIYEVIVDSRVFMVWWHEMSEMSWLEQSSAYAL